MNTIYKFDPYQALKTLVEVTADHVGNDFIKISTLNIKKIFNADLVFITKALDFSPTNKVSVLYSTDESMSGDMFLAGTPCKLVFDNKIIQVDKNVKLDYKKLQDSEFESFYGIPIYDGKELCVGHIAIYSKVQRKLPKELEDIATIYSRKIQRESKRHALEMENERIRAELESLTIIDPLTNIYNRRHFIKICNDVLMQVKRKNTTATLAYMDIDNFKKLNDVYGHDGGDEVLVKLAQIMSKNQRAGIDNIFRIGGEEFCIISTSSDLNSAKNNLERIMSELKNEFIKTRFGIVTLSIGLAQFKKNDTDINDIIKVADSRMYIAKETGKNRICLQNNK